MVCFRRFRVGDCEIFSRRRSLGFQQFCEIRGIDLMAEKAEICHTVSLLGLMCSSPTKENNFSLNIRHTEDKATLRDDLIVSILGDGRVSHQVLEGLNGELSFPQTVLFGKFGRCEMRRLCRKLYAKTYWAAISGRGISILNWRLAVLREFRSRVARPWRANLILPFTPMRLS